MYAFEQNKLFFVILGIYNSIFPNAKLIITTEGKITLDLIK